MRSINLRLCLLVLLSYTLVGILAQGTVTDEEGTIDLDTATTTATATDEQEQVIADDNGTANQPNTGEERVAAAQDDDESSSASIPVQSGPFIDLLGPSLLSYDMVGPEQMQFKELPTNEALNGKKVVGLYFSADWW
jgi:hypothetical protein